MDTQHHHKADDNWTSLGYACQQINSVLVLDLLHIPRPGVTGRDNERTVPVRSATGTSPLGGTREPGAKLQRKGETPYPLDYYDRQEYYDNDHGW